MTSFSNTRLAIGTYAGNGGAGVHAVADDGTLCAAYPDAMNVSFGVYSSRFDLHYLVDERDAGAVGTHRYAQSDWQSVAYAPTGGAAPCHAALNHAQTLLAVANYGSGSVSLFRLDADGLPIAPPQVHANHGHGPNPERQEAPHAHWVGFSPDDRWLYQTDLGTDQILAFPIDESGGLGAPRVAYAAPPGSGPRHLLLHPAHPDRAYLVSELANTLTLLDRAGDDLVARGRYSTLPDGWHGESIVAHLIANRAGDRLYVSNRGHDSIAVFALDAAGEPHLLQHAPTGGAYPRALLLREDKGAMIVAHEQGQTVTTLDLAADGRLTPTGFSLPVPGAAFVFVAEGA
ncbi:beta-propeller fold lactonase family protein [Sphingomonas sp. PB2P19]|uniref:lactonase family protein n=1 Tax=Sphingomonas rhamnosi TaxID=3096156 RepID=UPI002FCA484E